MNLVCNTELTTQGTVGQCECRPDMRWNTAEGECQFFLDVDCSSFTYDTKPSATVNCLQLPPFPPSHRTTGTRLW